ncbi:MAG: hypothetical protein V1720_22105 [bacterium]
MKIFLFTFFLALSQIFAQESKILIEAGNNSIPVEEFKRRFELSPQIQAGKDRDSVKKEFLYTLIAEKLWANQARNLLYDTTDYVKYSVKTIEKMLVRDELYKKKSWTK